MKTRLSTRLMSLLLIALILLPTMMPLTAVFAEDITTYVLNCDHLDPVSAGSKANGDTDTCGTENFFTINYSSNTKIDNSSKKFEDGFEVGQRINFGGSINLEGEKPINCLSFVTQGPATVKIWWVSGGYQREFGIYDDKGNLVTQTTNAAPASNLLYISEITIPSEGQYYLGGITGNNYIFKVTVKTKTLDKGPRADWSTVSAPSIKSVENKDGKIAVTVNAFVDHHGGDLVRINLIEDGKVISTARSTSVKNEHSFVLTPVKSGNYSLQAVLVREGEEDKTSEIYNCSYTLPLEAPYVTNVTNHGSGKALIVWNPVREAESYLVSIDGGEPVPTTDRELLLEGLSIGEHKAVLTSVRGEEKVAADEISFTITEDAQYGWNYVVYGPSAKPGATNNSYKINEDGTVTISSINSSGKLQPKGADGLGFYYTAVPADKNFTMRAKIKVDKWSFTNGQEGFGLMVTDHVPSTDYFSGDFWTNQYQALSTKIEYRYESDDEGNSTIYTTDSILGTKYTMKLGVGTISKIGIDQGIIDRTTLGETGLIVGQTGYLKSVLQTLETVTGDTGMPGGTYNIISNWLNSSAPEGTMEERYRYTELDLEIQKNNTGYFITFYDSEGNIVRQIKNYEHDALEKFDSDYVYVGMFAARYAVATFTDVSLTLVDEEDDKPAEERPIEYITPTVTITSTTDTASSDYEFIADTNLDGTLEILVNNKVILTDIPVEKFERFVKVLDLSEHFRYGENYLRVRFTPDPDQKLEPYTEISSTKPVSLEITINYYKGSYHRKSLYVSPKGTYNGNGSKENPYDIFTAVKVAIPGQTIVLMEGTYELKEGLKIQRGMNGTEGNPIRMIADPEAKTRPVIDFVHEGTGILHGGNYWYFYGFDVTNSLDGQKGFQVSGNNNVLENIHTYHNGNTGIQLSRYSAVDLFQDQWPANNLVLNCTSYGNADSGYEDADGFAAKLTIGEGNVFDGCVAYNNADDGWDLFAKVATGPIGSVTIKNSVAYGNGYLEDGTNAGNGNGFKLGGDSLSGYHKLINCIAFNNKAKGIDSNSCPDIQVENCISYNNGSYNVAFYTNTAPNTDFSAKGIISFKDESITITHPTLTDPLGIGESFKPKGNQDEAKYINSTNYYWMGGSSANDAGEKVTADMFVSLEFTGITRNEDGTINMNGFLELNGSAPDGAGTTGASTPSTPPELVPDIKHTYSKDYTSDDPYVHWLICDCGDKGSIGEHTFEFVTDKEPTATESGWKHSECTVCHYKMPSIEIPALGVKDCVEHIDEDNDNICDVCGNELKMDPPCEQPTTPPSIFEDFGGFWAWLWNEILKFFASIFGGNV